MTSERSLYKSITSRFGSQYVIQRSQFNNKELLIRLADHSDYNHVLALSAGIYSGMDYIMSKYHWFLDTGNTFMFITLLDGKPECFMVTMIINDYAILAMAGRASSSTRGSGVFALMSSAAKLFLMKMFPGIYKQWSIGVMVKGRESLLKNTESMSMFRYNVTFFETTPKLQQKCGHLSDRYTTITQPQEVPLSEIESTFSQPSALKVFTFAQFCVDQPGIIYDVKKENVAKAAQTNHVFVSFSNQLSGRLDAVSFVRWFKVPIGTLLVLYYYGKETLYSFTAHVLKSVHTYFEGNRECRGELRLMLNFPLGITANEVMTFMEKNGLGCRERFFSDGPTVCDVSFMTMQKQIDYFKVKL